MKCTTKTQGEREREGNWDVGLLRDREQLSVVVHVYHYGTHGCNNRCSCSWFTSQLQTGREGKIRKAEEGERKREKKHFRYCEVEMEINISRFARSLDTHTCCV